MRGDGDAAAAADDTAQRAASASADAAPASAAARAPPPAEPLRLRAIRKPWFQVVESEVRWRIAMQHHAIACVESSRATSM